jgi:BirA family biotin operon repressor/biotin-[acetyl-CoA-carboxylase] ligase
VAEALAGLAQVQARIKWPNDVRVGGRKVCGVLAEAGAAGEIEYLVLGIGINVNMGPDDFPLELTPLATSLRIETGQTWERGRVFAAVMARLEHHLAALAGGGVEEVLGTWRSLDETLGRRVRVQGEGGGFAGKAAGLREDGALLVQDEWGAILRPVLAGDVFVMEG